jgi:dihydroorotase
MINHWTDLKIQDAQVLLWSQDRGWHQEVTSLWINKGRIQALGMGHGLRAHKELSLRGLTVLPGLIDSQVHFREPGFTHKEDLESGTRGALLGGITTVFEMPNTHPPTTTPEELHRKFEKAKNRCFTHYAFFSGGTQENASFVSELESHPHSPGLKIFMGSSFGPMLVDNQKDLHNLLVASKRRVTVHCEDQNMLNQNKNLLPKNPDVSLHSQWRSPESCYLATKNLLSLARSLNKKVHVLHVSTKQEVDLLKNNQDIATFEVLPQHLTLVAPECYYRIGSLSQQNPPIRELEHQKALWNALNLGYVTTLGSDHAPHTLEEKGQPYPESPSGMPGVQTLVPIMLNHVHQHRLKLERFVELMTHGVHRTFHLKNKGFILPNFDGDFTIVDLKKEVVLTHSMMATKSRWTPFHNEKVTGFPLMTVLKGQVAMREGEILTPPLGQPVEFDPLNNPLV